MKAFMCVWGGACVYMLACPCVCVCVCVCAFVCASMCVCGGGGRGSAVQGVRRCPCCGARSRAVVSANAGATHTGWWAHPTPAQRPPPSLAALP